ncbi:MAG: hypothetical protein KAU28_05550, partial [Phycisphaerae bacterium]|nr:hypothetical protein [Phycisphaerae bacterium]
SWGSDSSWDNSVPTSGKFSCVSLSKTLTVSSSGQAAHLVNLGAINVNSALNVQVLHNTEYGSISVGSPGSSLIVADTLTNRGTISHTAGSVQTGGDLAFYAGIKSEYPATYSQSGGTLHVGGNLYLSSGIYYLKGGQLEVSDEIRIRGGRGRLDWINGTIQTPKIVSSGGSLAMYFDFDLFDLASGALTGGNSVGTAEDGGTILVTGGATTVHNSGTVKLNLTVGDPSTGKGTLLIGGDAILDGPIGVYNGLVRQSGGSIGEGTYRRGNIRVGSQNVQPAMYELQGGEIHARESRVKGSGAGDSLFRQTGGSFYAGVLEVGGRVPGAGESGTYELEGGLLKGGLELGSSSHTVPLSASHFVHKGGTFETEDIRIYGFYDMFDGQIRPIIPTRPGTLLVQRGIFNQTGGSVWMRDVYVGAKKYYDVPGDKKYLLSGGELKVAQSLRIAGTVLPTPVFEQSGGRVEADGITVGDYRPGVYTMSGGEMSVGRLYLGRGRFEILNPSCEISVSDYLSIREGEITAVPGAKIHMTGAAFQNQSTNSANLAGLGNLTMIFEGGTEDIDPFEVA